MKLSIQDLAMFLGADAQHEVLGIRPITTKWLSDIEENCGEDADIECESIKPILRPISDMTDMENDLLAEYVDNSGADNKEECLQEMAILSKKLIEFQFDVFGWIEKGLAIDKTKIN